MFDFIAMAQAKMAGFVDTARSREDTLEQKQGGGWAYVKSASHMVFKRPLMGQDSMNSVQAAHLYLSGRGWLIAEMEELERRDSPVRLRTGIPEGAASASGEAAAAGTATGSGSRKGASVPRADSSARGLFPVSPMAPERVGEADRLRYRLSLRNGGSLALVFRPGAGQALVKTESPSRWILENRIVGPGARPVPQPKDDAYLAGNAFLILSDTLLRATAASLAPPGADPQAIAAGVYAWVRDHLEFRLGAALFGTSSEVLRSLKGDCSEAAVLTAALLRARGVPARIALGFASVGRGVFIGHAWCEARLNGSWVGVDAALREFPAGVERVKLAELDGAVDLRISATNLMMRLISNLDVEILAAWKGDRSLRLRRYQGNAGEAEAYFKEILNGVGKPE